MSPPSRYSFVNARPQTKAEKRQTRTAIRSHIGRWTQEKQQKLDGQPGSASDKVSPHGTSRTISHSPASSEATRSQPRDKSTILWPESSDTASETRDPSAEDTEDDFSKALEITLSPHSRSRRSPLSPFTASSPTIQLLGSDVLDPFGTLPSNFPSQLISRCHEYSLKVLWPGLTPRPVIGETPAASKEWFPMVKTDTVALHSLLFGALSHQRLNLLKGAGPQSSVDVSGMEQDLRRCEIESVALINKALRKNKAITDEMIVSVLCMAANAWDMTLERFLRAPPPLPVFDPLLKSLQWLDVYGLLSVHPVHAAGLVQLITLKGGLHTVKAAGLAATVFYSGIINATKYLTAPIFPFVPLIENGAPTPTLWTVIGSHPKELRDEYVFSGLFDLGLTQEMALVLVAMQHYGESVQNFVDGASQELDLARFCDSRNLIQHTLLSIPAGDSLPDSAQQRPIYEPTRLAMMIYSLTVIFPLPTQTAPLGSLVEQLGMSLRETNWPTTQQARRLLVWILVVGGIAARDVPDQRAWFIAVLRKMTAKDSKVAKFEDLKRDVLSRLLWLDRSCDGAGRLFWAEVVGLGD